MAVRTRARAGRTPDFAPPPRYEVRGLIATGGMGTVWSAYDTLLRRDVAIKVLSEGFAADKAAALRFRREARAAARLSNHPHVVSIFDVGEGNPIGTAPSTAAVRPFLVMEHLPGGAVADALKAGQVRPERALRWLAQAAAALDYGHRHDVVHRDVKPHNFLLDAAGDLRITDFGVATIGDGEQLTRTGQLLGTAAYISPEQAVGEPASAASDRYALAVTAFELLVGTRPFNAETATAQLRQRLDERPPAASRRNTQLPRAVDGVLSRAMSKRPQDRFSSASEFVDALKAAMYRRPGSGAGMPMPAALTGSGTRTAMPMPRAPARSGLRRRAPAAAALICAAMIAGLVLAFAASPGRHQLTRSPRPQGARANQSPATRHRTQPPIRSSPAPESTTTDLPASAVAPAPPPAAVRHTPNASKKAHRSGRPRGSTPARQVPQGLVKQPAKRNSNPAKEHAGPGGNAHGAGHGHGGQGD